MNLVSDEQDIEDCRPCRIASAVVVSLDVCHEYGLDCALLKQKVEAGTLTEDEALEHIQNLKQDAPGEAVEILEDICGMIEEEMEED